MAKCSTNFKEVIRTVTEQVEDGVVLTLTKEEAVVLAVVLRSIGGCPHESPRKHCQQILYSLPEKYSDEAEEMERKKDLFKGHTVLYFN